VRASWRWRWTLKDASCSATATAHSLTTTREPSPTLSVPRPPHSASPYSGRSRLPWWGRASGCLRTKRLAGVCRHNPAHTSQLLPTARRLTGALCHRPKDPSNGSCSRELWHQSRGCSLSFEKPSRQRPVNFPNDGPSLRELTWPLLEGFGCCWGVGTACWSAWRRRSSRFTRRVWRSIAPAPARSGGCSGESEETKRCGRAKQALTPAVTGAGLNGGMRATAALQETIGWHWDKDEYSVDAFQVNIHPHLSTVTYLR
jgi:hypothetical protein